ncbi:hypothetical protein HHK36_010214 [Tetracentron sinense]|uniref:CRM domain-containing protein n=1 Tax=Tetracentron sinense TaxID=13715 RepID=A0A834ZH49_TETSI|nr:hypothetical protein HHK36_010214 [Tetracentron sinense]
MATSSHLLHHLFRSPSSLLLLKPLCITPSTLCPHKPLLTLFSSRSSPLRPRFFCNFSPSSASSVAFPQTPSPHLLHENDSDFDSKDELAEEEQNEKVELEETLNGESEAKLPTLSVKEKKELSSYAHSLGKKLKCQQVGKSGVTSSVAASFVENLESNELLKYLSYGGTHQNQSIKETEGMCLTVRPQIRLGQLLNHFGNETIFACCSNVTKLRLGTPVRALRLYSSANRSYITVFVEGSGLRLSKAALQYSDSLRNFIGNSLTQIKVHNSCPGELADVVKQLEKATGSVAVGQIGRTVILYRPSITKLKAEEKKRQTRRVFVRKELRLKPTLPAHADSLGDFNFEVQRGN